MPYGANIFINCDSKHFVNLADEPSRLLEEGEVRQSRPLYIWLGAAAGALVNMVFGTEHPYNHYLSYVVLNLLLLYASLLLYDRVTIKSGADTGILLIFSVFLVCNDVTKAFFWSANEQLFSIFSPLLSMAGIIAVTGSPHPKRSFYLFTTGCGILMLAYANFAPVFLALSGALFFRSIGDEGLGRRKALMHIVSGLFFFIIPTLIWVITVTFTAGSYFSHEVSDYGQGVWVLYSMQRGFAAFTMQFLKNTGLFLKTFWSFEILPFILAAAVLSVMNLRGKNKWLTNAYKDYILIPVTFTFLAFFLFYWLLGYYKWRLTYTLVPPLVSMSAALLSWDLRSRPSMDRPLKFVLILIVLGWLAFHVLKHGPYA